MVCNLKAESQKSAHPNLNFAGKQETQINYAEIGFCNVAHAQCLEFRVSEADFIVFREKTAPIIHRYWIGLDDARTQISARGTISLFEKLSAAHAFLGVKIH